MVRADGSTVLGMGHLYRSLACIRMLDPANEITFVCREVTPEFEYEIKKLGYNIIPIEDENEFLALCDPEKTVLMDGHHFPEALYQRVEATGAAIVAIDDLHDKYLPVDVIINQAPGIRPHDYTAAPFTVFGLGPKYALLRGPFLEVAKKSRRIDRISTCFICFGGGDQYDLTRRAAEIASQYARLSRISIVTGSAYRFRESLAAWARNDNRITIHHDIGDGEMAALMTASDLAIVPCSTILLEVFAAGCIPVAGCYVENQKYFYRNFLDLNAFIDAKDLSGSAIRSALDEAFGLSDPLPRIIDGNSGYRIRKLFQLLENLKKIRLRPAMDTDVDITYRWASDPLVRQYSFTKSVIGHDEHQSWFFRKIEDPLCVYYIAENEDGMIGSIRFDVTGSTAVISYLIDPAYHGKGLGQILLIKGGKTFISSFVEKDQPFEITGYVTKDNRASQVIFERSGFAREDQGDRYKYTTLLNR